MIKDQLLVVLGHESIEVELILFIICLFKSSIRLSILGFILCCLNFSVHYGTRLWEHWGRIDFFFI